MDFALGSSFFTGLVFWTSLWHRSCTCLPQAETATIRFCYWIENGGRKTLEIGVLSFNQRFYIQNKLPRRQDN